MESLDLRAMVQSHSWTWLLDLGRHLNVAIDIVDDEFVPLLPIEGSDTSDDHAALRSLLSTLRNVDGVFDAYRVTPS